MPTDAQGWTVGLSDSQHRLRTALVERNWPALPLRFGVRIGGREAWEAFIPRASAFDVRLALDALGERRIEG